MSQRKYFDIASVNFASRFDLKEGLLQDVHLSIGGVGPIPTYLHQTSAFLAKKVLSENLIKTAIPILNSEIAPISDARGAADYKRLLARQLFIAQFLGVEAIDLVFEKIIK